MFGGKDSRSGHRLHNMWRGLGTWKGGRRLQSRVCRNCGPLHGPSVGTNAVSVAGWRRDAKRGPDIVGHSLPLRQDGDRFDRLPKFSLQAHTVAAAGAQDALDGRPEAAEGNGMDAGRKVLFRGTLSIRHGCSMPRVAALGDLREPFGTGKRRLEWPFEEPWLFFVTCVRIALDHGGGCMNSVQFWKNFNLGTELDISGRFIYNGLRALHEMDTLRHEEEIFEVLYDLAVGLERLLKIAVILMEHDSAADQCKFERSLITHNHQELLRRVRVRFKPCLGGVHNELLQLLGAFYKTHRYGRYSATSTQATGKEKIALHAFLEKHLKISIVDEQLWPTPNSPRIKKFIGKTCGKIASEMYEVVKAEAGRLGLYTYELRNPSKAAKIFLSNEYDFLKEDVLWRELLVFLVRSERTVGHVGFLRSLPPLAFDPENEVEYLQCFTSTEKMLDVVDELDQLYADLADKGTRLNEIGIIGNPLVFFDDVEDEDSNDEDREPDEDGAID